MQRNSDRQGGHLKESDVLAEKKLCRIFLGALVLCALIVWQLFFLTGRAARFPTLVRASLLPILLWTLTVTAYAFHALWKIAKQRKDKLYELTHKDSLTGAFTETYLDKKLAEERRGALETGRSDAFAYIRLCGLETVNKDYGYALGNIVLKALVQIVQYGVSPKGIVARLAGEQFAVLLPQTTVQEAGSILEGVSARIRAYRMDLGKQGCIHGLHAAVGIVAYPADGESFFEIAHVARARARAKGPA